MFQDLPKKERSFSLEEKGLTTGLPYKGEFTVRAILNMGQKHALELEKTMLQADMKSPTPGLSGISNVLAELRVRIIKGPTWWRDSEGGALIDDENILIALYTKILEEETAWRQELEDATKESVEKTDPNSLKEKSES